MRSMPSGPTTDTMRGSAALPFGAFAEIDSPLPGGAEKRYSAVSAAPSVAPEVQLDLGTIETFAVILPLDSGAGTTRRKYRPVAATGARLTENDFSVERVHADRSTSAPVAS